MAVGVGDAAGAIVVARRDVVPGVGSVGIADKPTIIDAEWILIDEYSVESSSCGTPCRWSAAAAKRGFITRASGRKRMSQEHYSKRTR